MGQILYAFSTFKSVIFQIDDEDFTNTRELSEENFWRQLKAATANKLYMCICNRFDHFH